MATFSITVQQRFTVNVLFAALNVPSGETALHAARTINGITDGALEDTIILDGFLTTDTKGNATVQLSLDLKTGDQPQERIGLRFRLTQSTSTTSTLPSLTLPEGADVQEFMGVGSVL